MEKLRQVAEQLLRGLAQQRGPTFRASGAPAEEGARPIIYYDTSATCWRPEVKGLTTMTNSMYNGWRFEDVWLDK